MDVLSIDRITNGDPWRCREGGTYLTRLTGYSRRRVNDLHAKGLLPGTRIGRDIFLTLPELTAWWERQHIHPATPTVVSTIRRVSA